MVAIITGNALGTATGSGSVLGAHGQLGAAATGRFGSNVTVNAITGNLIIQNQDEVLQGIGPDAALLRTYNSLGLLNDDNGDNWRISGQRFVGVVTAGSRLRLTDWDGSQRDYIWDAVFVRGDGGSGAYVNKDGGGAYDWITYASGTWTLTDGDSLVVQTFAETAAGRLTTQRDTSGNQLTFTYDTSNRLSRITTANGEIIDLSWNGNQLTQMTTRNAGGNATGTRTRYSYDSSNRLSAVTIDLSPGDNSIADGEVVTFEYTYDGSSKRVASITETGSSNFVSFTYIQVGGVYRIATVIQTAADGGAATTSFSYDTAARRTTITDALGKVRVIAYDTAGNITSITSPADGSGAASQVVRFDYNSNGDVTSHTDGLGKVTSYTYDAHGNQIESIDPVGNRMRYEYDSRNLLLKKIQVVNTVGLDRLPITGFDEAFYLTVNSDILNAGELLDPALHYATYGWHEGRDPNALFDTSYYLSANPDVAASGINPLEHYLQVGWREGRIPAAGVTTAEFIARYVNQTSRYAYGSAGQLRFTVSSEGRVAEYRYNGLGQRTSTLEYTKDFYPVAWSMPSWDNVSEAQLAAWVAGLGSTSAVQRTDITYDFRGNVASEVSYADLNVNRVQYSKFEQGSAGWWAWQSHPDILQGSIVSGTDAGTGKAYLGQSFRTASADQIVSLASDQLIATTPGEWLAVRAGVGSSSGVSNTTLRVQFFDVNGGWVTETNVGSLAGGQAFNTQLSGFVYVPANAVRMRLVLYASTNSNNVNHSFTMTEPMVAQAAIGQTGIPAFTAGPATSVTPLGHAQTPSNSWTTYTYDQFGNLLARTTSGTAGSELFTYDGLGRLRSATGLAGAITTTAYNDSARSTMVTMANGATRTSVYSARGEVLSYVEAAAGVPSETETYKYDKLGRLRITADAVGMRDFTFYDDAGRKTGYMDRKGQLTEYRYDAAGRLVATIAYATQMSLGAIAALYDANGQPGRATIAGARPASSNYDRWEWTVYDAADRVVQKIETVRGASEGQSGKVTSYTYDRAGNLAKTVESANVLSPVVIAQMMAQTPGSNLLTNAGFNGAAGWRAWNGQGIVNAGSPYTGTYQGLHYLKAEFSANGAGQVGSLGSDDASLFAVTAGQQLSVKTGVEAVGPIDNLSLVIWWLDANGSPMSNTWVKTLNGYQSYNSQMEGVVTVPTGAVKARLEVYMTTSGAGAGSFVLVEPKVSVVSDGVSLIPPIATNSADRTTRNFYSKDGLLIGQIDGVGAFSQYFYDRAGRITKTTRYANLAAQSLWTSGSFADVLASVGASAKDRTDYSVYDGAGRVRYKLDANLRPTEFVYDAAGQVIRTVDYAGSIEAASSYSVNSVKTRIAALGLAGNAATRVSRAVYDGAGRLAYSIDAEGGVSAFFYDNQTGLKVRTLVYAVRYPDSASADIGTVWSWAVANVATGYIETRSIHDKLGRLVYSVDPEGYITEYQYDLDDRVLKEIRYPASYTVVDGATVASVAAQIGGAINDPQTVVTTFAYDAVGQVIDSWDGEGVRTHYEYTAFGQVWRTVSAAGTTEEAIEEAVYDAAGRLLTSNHAVGTAEFFADNYSYDGIGNLTHHSTDSANSSSIAWFGYDAVGNRTSQTVRIDNATGSNASSYFAYDAFGNLVKATDPLGFSSYSYYDKLGRATLQIDAEGYATATSYDAIGTVHSVTRHAVRAVGIGSTSAAPTLATNAGDAITTFGYDRLGRVTATTDAMGFIESATYGAFGNKLTSTNKLGGVTNYGYDRRGLMVWERPEQVAYDWSGNVLASNVRTDYFYDSRGNLIKKIASNNIASQALRTDYAYDRLNRLIQQTDPAFFGMTPITSWQYDKRGNLILQTAADGGRTFAWYDDNDRKIAELSPVGAVSHFNYDANGNLLWRKTFAEPVPLPTMANGAIPAPGGDYRETIFAYDARSMLKSTATQAVTIGSVSAGNLNTEFRQLVASNNYDANGRLIVETDARGEKTYHYYDKLGRETAKLDQEGFLTIWERDAEGNVLFETRYANRVIGVPPVGGAIPPEVVADPTNDRVTTFSYDKLGRRLSETRKNVVTASIGSNGQRHATIDDATIYYTYNALGQVTAKSEASLAVSDWTVGYNPQAIATSDVIEGRWGDVDYSAVQFNATGAGQAISVAADYRMPLAANNGDQLYVDLGLEGQGPTAYQAAYVHFFDANGAHLGTRQIGAVNGNVALNSRLAAQVDIPAGAAWLRLEVYSNTSGSGAGSVLIAEPRLTLKTAQGGTLNAFGARTDYVYDSQGRLIEQRDPVAQDSNAQGNAQARHTSYFYYDGNNNLVRTVERAEAQGGGYAAGYSAADDRVNIFGYNGNKLQWTQDPLGNQRNSWYDIMGRKTYDYYQRANSAGVVDNVNANYEGNLTSYDFAGRVVSQWQAAQTSGGVWNTQGPVTQFTYNTFGEIATRVVGGNVEESFEYDKTGRVVKTTGGDGVIKFAIYDANGNATLLIQSNGKDLTGFRIDDSNGAASNIFTYIGAIDTMSVTDVVAIITTYDKRNMALATREPNRTIADVSNVAQTVTQTLVRSRSYTAFGEVASETDARGNTTNYTYNTMGRLTQKMAPTVNVTDEAGETTAARPTENFAYDLSGRMVGSQGANGFWTTRSLRSGSGYGGSEALTLKEFRPDSSMWEARYNAFGNVVESYDGLGRKTANGYDKANRLIQVTRPSGLVEGFAYDILGQRIAHWNNVILLPPSNGLGTPVSNPTTATGSLTYYGSTYDGSWTVALPANPYLGTGPLSIASVAGPMSLSGDPYAPGSAVITVDIAAYYYSGGGTFQLVQNGVPLYQGQISYYNGYGQITIQAYAPPATTTPPAWGDSLPETTDYDIQGRVTKEANFAGDVTNYTYSWNNVANGGMGLTGGWTKTASFANGHTTSETTDYFGRMLSRTDMGGRVYTYSYNRAGQLVNQVSTGGQSIAYTYFNTGRMATMKDNAGSASGNSVANVGGSYTYDADGNRTYERLAGTKDYYYYYNGNYYYGTPYEVVQQEGKGTYDALNRLISFTDAGAAGNGTVSVTNSYDAAGNVRHTQAAHATFTANQALGANVTEDYWYKYDSLGRMTLTKGSRVGQAIVANSADSYAITYNMAGERATQTRLVALQSGTTTSQEIYAYNAAGQLTSVSIAKGGAAAVLRASNTFDLLGRVTDYREYATDGVTVQFNRYGISYDNRGAVLYETTSLRRVESDGYLYVSYAGITNTYSAGGVLATTNSSNYRYKNGTTYGDTPDTYTSYSYDWWDGAQQGGVSFDSDTGSGSNPVYTTNFSYDVNGHLASVAINDGRPRTVNYITDASGQILKRTEADNIYYNASTQKGGDPIQAWWFFDGKQVGTTGNNGNDDPVYENALNERVQTPGTATTTPFRLGSEYASQYSDFDQAYNSLSPGEGAGAGSAYTVRSGDTLNGIAQAVFGDASLWYLIADANGLNGSSQLAAGQVLRIPGTLANVHNTSETFRPYDAGRAIGDVQPTTPQPPKKPKCGVFGQILLAVVAIAVTIVSTGAAVAALAGNGTTLGAGIGAVLGTSAGAGVSIGMGAGIAATTFGAAMGSIVSQGVGVATGIQDKFSWKAVGLSALSGFLGPLPVGPIGDSALLGRVVGGALTSAITQGIAVGVGLQDKFSWAGVAAAGAGAGIGYAVGGAFKKAGNSFAAAGQRLATSGAALLASAATRSVLEGTSFGDNVLAGLPDVIGNTVGNFVAEKVSGMVSKAEARAHYREIMATPDGMAFLQQAGYDPSKPPKPADLLRQLGDVSGPANGETIGKISGRISDWLLSEYSNALGLPNATFGSAALHTNTAIQLIYSALGTEIPNFQWTALGGVVAKQVRGEIQKLADIASGADSMAVKAFGPIASTLGMSAWAAANYMIGKLIRGQVTVVTDVGSYALAYQKYGAETVARIAREGLVRQAFKLQARADSLGGGAVAAGLGRDAAFLIGQFEQQRLQPMWNDLVLKFAAKTMQDIGMLDTDIHSPLGDIRTPSELTGGPWDLDYRVGIARNGFDFMYQNVFKPSPLSTYGQNAMQHFFGDVWQQNQPRWKPTPGGGT